MPTPSCAGPSSREPTSITFLAAFEELFEAGAPKQVRAALTAGPDAAPLPGRQIRMELRGQIATATTDAEGIATAALTIPVAKARGPADLTVSFAGDAAHEPSEAKARVVVYRPTSFVIWGGNPEGLRVGQRVVFWGMPWSAQVTGGDYHGGADFHGYATLAGPLALCQAAAPPLDRGCWSALPGKVRTVELFAPVSISVIVATSIAREGQDIHGNVAAVVVLDVDAEPCVGPSPDQPGYGVIRAVLADGAGVFGAPSGPTLSATQAQPAASLPGEAFEVVVALRNDAPAAATRIVVEERFTGAEPPSASATLGRVDGLGRAEVRLRAAVRAVPPRGSGESSTAYASRLADDDGAAITAEGTIASCDEAGRPCPTLSVGSAGRLSLPRLAAGAAPQLGALLPGQEAIAAVEVQNQGSAAAVGAVLAMAGPGGAPAGAPFGAAPGAAVIATAPVTVPAIEPRQPGEDDGAYLARLQAADGAPLSFALALTWSDAAGNAYGPMDAAAAASRALPALAVALEAPAAIQAGAELAATAVCSNQGHAEATSIEIEAALPDGAIIALAPPPGPLAPGGEIRLPFAFQVPAAQPAGPITVRVTARWRDALQRGYGPLGAARATDVTIEVGPPSGPPPTVSLSAPADGAEITAPAEVLGTVSAGAWRLEARMGGAAQPQPAATILVASGLGPASGRLGTFDPTGLLNGTYELRLTAETTGGQASASVAVVVRGGLKIGHFSLSFVDLEVPLAGLPIQIIRTYDSRDRRAGDFGIGWSLRLRDVRVEASAILGRHWRQTVTGGWIPRYTLQPTRPLLVTVTLPDGKVYRFQATVTPESQQVVPIQSVRLGFRALPGTRGSLIALDQAEGLVVGSAPGDVEIVSPASLEPLDPTRFQLTDERGNVHVIRRGEGLERMTDPNGNTLEVRADGISHSSGRSVVFERDAEGRIRGITDPAGRAMTYERDARGDLVRYTDREGNATTFTYDERHNLLGIQDPRGVQPVRNDYDDAGRLVSHTDALGRTVTYARDLGGRQEIITDQLGQATVYEYDTRGNILRVTSPGGAVRSFTYDDQDRRLTETDPLGNTTRHTYDASGNETSRTDPLGSTTLYTYDDRGLLLTETDPRGGVTSHSYDAAGNKLGTTDALGHVTRYTYGSGGLVLTETDPLGQVTRYEYDATGNRVAKIDPLGLTTTFTYDPAGNRTSERIVRTTAAGPEELITRFEHDRMGRVTAVTYPDGSTERIIYDALGKEAARVDGAGRESRYEHDELGRVVRAIHPEGTSERFDHDAAGRLILSTDRAGRATRYEYDAEGRITRVTTPDGASTSSEYDAVGRLTAATDPAGAVTRYEYDAAGRNTRVLDAAGNVTTFTYDATGNPASMTDAGGRTITQEWDILGRLTRRVFPDGTAVVSGYDALGRLTSRTDQAGLTTHYEYDGAGRLARVVDAMGGVTSYAYDEAGHRVSQIDAAGRETRFEHDWAGRLVRRTLPLGTTETFAYDPAGNLIRRTDPSGRTTSFDYDAAGRPLRISPDPASGEPATSFAYTVTGKRASMTDGCGTVTYEYDAADRLISKATPWGTLSYSYDARGLLTSLRSSNDGGAAADYVWDALERLSAVIDPGLGTTTYAYDTVGNLAAMTLPNGVVTSYTYDALNRLSRVDVQRGAPLAAYAYALGPAGNRLSVAELGGRTVTYAYDALYRLVAETIAGAADPSGNGAISYTYDAVGNRLHRGSTVPAVPAASYSYDAGDRLAGDEYDAGGRTIRSGGRRFDYDTQGRLVAMDGGAVTLRYDGDGQRVQRSAGGVITSYLIDDLNPSGLPQVVEEIEDGEVRRVYTYGHAVLSMRWMEGGSWLARFHIHDGHGSVRSLADPQGEVTDSYEHDAFGVPLQVTGATPNDRMYLGEPHDSALGLIYLRARYLDPRAGRFFTLDEVDGNPFDPPSLHRYLYAHANPVNLRDPTGRMAIAATMPAAGMHLALAALAMAALYTILTMLALALLIAVGATTIAHVREAQRAKEEIEAERRKTRERAEEERRRQRGGRLLFHYTSKENAEMIFSTGTILSGPASGPYPPGAYATDIAGWLPIEIMRRSQLVEIIFGRNTGGNYARTAWFVAFLEHPRFRFRKLAFGIYWYKGTATIIPLLTSPNLLGE